MKGSILILLLGFLAENSSGQGPLDGDWLANLSNSINQLTANIQGNVQRNVQRINQQVQSTVDGELAKIDQMNRDLAETIAKDAKQRMTLNNVGSTIFVNGVNGNSGSYFSGQGPTILVNGPDGKTRTVLSGQGSTIFVTGNGSTTRTVFSGRRPNGEPYSREIEDRVVDYILYHTERIYNPVTKNTDVSSYTVDLKDPNSRPIPVGL